MIFSRKKYANTITPPVVEHTPEVDEIMTDIPGSVIRNSLTYIFFMLVTLIIGTYFFKMPEIVTGKILLTTSSAPTPLVSKVNGRIVSLHANDGTQIQRNQLIAILESPVRFDDLLALESVIDSLTGNWKVDVKHINLPEHVMLGDLQNTYFRFYRAFKDLRFVTTDQTVHDKISLHNRMIALKQQEVVQLNKQTDIRYNRHQVSLKIFRRDSTLFTQGVVSSQEYDAAYHSYLTEKEAYLNFYNTVRALEASILQTRQMVLEIETAQMERIRGLENELVEQLHVLQSQIGMFRERHVLIAPTAGTLTFTKYWSENQFVTQGERIATLVPQDTVHIHGRVTLTGAAIGKVEVGQKVNIKLAGFPYMRHGIIEGIVSGISLVPDEEGYIAEVQLKHGMTSKYEDELKFVHEMDGVAEIVIEDVRLLERLIAPLRSLAVNRN